MSMLKPGSIKLLVLVFLTTNLYCQPSNVRETISFNSGWKFINKEDLKGELTPNLCEPSYDDNAWKNISLPHTSHPEPLVVINPWQGVSWYRKTFDCNKAWKGKKVFINFEGAMQVAEVWLNGKHLLTHQGGYLPFVIDISEELNFDKPNLLALCLDNHENPEIPPGKPIADLDFCYYSGIYRNVFLTITSLVHITDPFITNSAEGGTSVTYPEVSDKKAVIRVKTQVINESSQPRHIFTEWSLFDSGNRKIASFKSSAIPLASNTSVVFAGTLIVMRPSLWFPDHPALYTLKITVFDGDLPVDKKSEIIGIRKLGFSGNTCVVNGRPVNLVGTNRHQEYPYIGNALPDNAQYRDAVKIREAGFNIVRLSHYPQSPAFMKACDELGLLVIDCIPGWQFFGNEEFVKHSYQDARELIRRDRNHACVAFWELSINETSMPDQFMKTMGDIANEESPDQKLFTCGWINSYYDLFIPARQHAKAPDYWKKHNDSRPFFTAEYGDWEYYAQNAGFNQTEFSDLKAEDRTSRQLRGYGEKRMLQQALNFQEAHNDNLKSANIGDANWLMFDYNRGYAPDIESSGIMDVFRLPKFAYYFYQSQRPPSIVSDKPGYGPVIKIASAWEEDSDKTIRVYSNCDEVALYYDDKLIERKAVKRDAYSDMLIHPPFLFRVENVGKGTLRAEGFLNNKSVAEDIVKSAGNPAKLSLNWDRSNKDLQTCDEVFVYASVNDNEGTLVRNAITKVHFSVEGDGELVGENPVETEAGIASILLKTGTEPGIVKITASCESLTPGTISILIKK